MSDLVLYLELLKEEGEELMVGVSVHKVTLEAFLEMRRESRPNAMLWDAPGDCSHKMKLVVEGGASDLVLGFAIPSDMTETELSDYLKWCGDSGRKFVILEEWGFAGELVRHPLWAFLKRKLSA